MAKYELKVVGDDGSIFDSVGYFKNEEELEKWAAENKGIIDKFKKAPKHKQQSPEELELEFKDYPLINP